MLPKVTLVLGGASSGKSAYAEALITSQHGRRVYVASAEPFDDEMSNKIARHQNNRGPDWDTIEAPLDVAGVLQHLNAGDLVLFDCVTLWLSNHLFADSDLVAEEDRLVASLLSSPASIVLVSNEVGQSVVPDNALSRRFRDAQGQLNQRLATHADVVVAVMAGLAVTLKGQLPDPRN